ncbi:MAG: heavy metal translocating P-type ATPase [Gemmatimonadota bacterium]
MSASEVRLRVSDMDCPSCLTKIQTRLEKIDGVVEVEGSTVSRTLSISFDGERIDAGRLQEEIGRLGYAAHPLDEDGERATTIWVGTRARITGAAALLFTTGLVLRLFGVTPTLVTQPFHDLHLDDLFFVLAALVGGMNFFGRGWRSARALSLDMNFLMTIAILGAAAVGEYLEAGAIAFLFSIAELLERFSVDRARASVEALVDLAPASARLVRNGEEIVVPADTLMVGDLVVVRPGEKIPTDGRVEDGLASVDQSVITGESVPVSCGAGDEVFAGSTNQDGVLRVRVDREAGQSTLARIIQLVEQAEASKTKSERFVDTFARYYTPAVTIGAILVAFGPPLILGAPFDVWFVRGLTLLVIACPCALVISTPVAVVSGVTAAARNGVLIKGGIHLETAGHVRVVAFDKTGTLTHGHPEVLGLHPEEGVNESELLERAFAVEAGSEHPIGSSIRRAAHERGANPEAWKVTGFQTIPGRGARAELDGEEYRVGRPDLFEGVASRPAPGELGSPGRTVVGVGRTGRFLGWISLGDSVREEAAAAVSHLRDVGIQHVVMLTGDNPETAAVVGQRLGVDRVHAGLLPEDKVDVVRALEAELGPVAMVGDGINDAPALAAATVGIAMGAAGSDTAIETADIALMGDDLETLPYLIELSRSANRVIRQNLAASLLVKGVLVAGVPLGWVSLVLAVVVGDLGVSLAVTANALRLGSRRR